MNIDRPIPKDESSRTQGQSVNFLSLFTREETLGALLPVVAVAIFWICRAVAA